MSGGADDARNKLGFDRVLGMAVAFFGITSQIINLSMQSATFEETRRMNAHIIRKDMMTYQMEAAKQAAEAAKSER